MKKRILLGVAMAVLLICATAHAQVGQVFDMEGDALSYEKLSTITTATGFTTTKVTLDTYQGKRNAKAVLISVEAAAVRFTLDGTTPVVTATSNGTGHLLNSGDSYVIRGYGNIQRFQCINAVDSSGALVFVTYFY